MSKTDKENVYKRMAELLKGGNIMLSDSCPDCHVPLFKMRDNKIICPSCNRLVIYVKHGEENILKHYQVIDNVLNTIVDKLSELNISILNEYEENKLKIKAELLNTLLEAYDRLYKLKKQQG